MDIRPVDTTAIAPLRFEPVAPVNANAVSALTTTSPGNASVVEFSPLAQLLAATLPLRSRAGVPLPTTANGSTTAFQQLVNAANAFVNAFNAFQDSINNGAATAFETAFNNALLAAIEGQNVSFGSSTFQSLFTSLAQFGINFQGSTNPANPNYFLFDLTALEAAYANSPLQTQNLFNNAFSTLSVLQEQLLVAQARQTLQQNLQVAAITASASGASTAAAVPNIASAIAVPVPAAAFVPAVQPAMLNPAATAPGANTAPVNPPATRDPIIALAVAAYRVIDNIVPAQIDPSATMSPEAIPDISETTRVEPIGPNTPRYNSAAGARR